MIQGGRSIFANENADGNPLVLSSSSAASTNICEIAVILIILIGTNAKKKQNY